MNLPHNIEIQCNRNFTNNPYWKFILIASFSVSFEV